MRKLFFSLFEFCVAITVKKLMRRVSEFRHLQRCPWFNSLNLVNTRAQGWPQLGWSLEIVYNSKKPTETCTVLPVKMLHQCCIILPQMLTARSSGKKNYWNDSGQQDMLSAENAMNLSSSDGLSPVSKQKTRRYKSFQLQQQTFQTTSLDISGMFLLCGERLCTVYDLWMALSIQNQN